PTPQEPGARVIRFDRRGILFGLEELPVDADLSTEEGGLAARRLTPHGWPPPRQRRRRSVPAWGPARPRRFPPPVRGRPGPGARGSARRDSRWPGPPPRRHGGSSS